MNSNINNVNIEKLMNNKKMIYDRILTILESEIENDRKSKGIIGGFAGGAIVNRDNTKIIGTINLIEPINSNILMAKIGKLENINGMNLKQASINSFNRMNKI